MNTAFDEKGKIFTKVISKRPISVVVQTAAYRIQGQIHVTPGERIKDELNEGEGFIAITDAIIFDLAGAEQFRTEFLTLNRDFIIWIIPSGDAGGAQSLDGAR